MNFLRVMVLWSFFHFSLMRYGSVGQIIWGHLAIGWWSIFHIAFGFLDIDGWLFFGWAFGISGIIGAPRVNRIIIASKTILASIIAFRIWSMSIIFLHSKLNQWRLFILCLFGIYCHILWFSLFFLCGNWTFFWLRFWGSGFSWKRRFWGRSFGTDARLVEHCVCFGFKFFFSSQRRAIFLKRKKVSWACDSFSFVVFTSLLIWSIFFVKRFLSPWTELNQNFIFLSDGYWWLFSFSCIFFAWERSITSIVRRLSFRIGWLDMLKRLKFKLWLCRTFFPLKPLSLSFLFFSFFFFFQYLFFFLESLYLSLPLPLFLLLSFPFTLSFSFFFFLPFLYFVFFSLNLPLLCQ